MGGGGIGWIERPAERGEAECVQRDGCPNLHTVLARTIAAALEGGEPPSSEPVDMFRPREVIIGRAALDAHPPDQVLTITVFDQS